MPTLRNAVNGFGARSKAISNKGFAYRDCTLRLRSGRNLFSLAGWLSAIFTL
jgi:hypothetical protein